MSARGTEALPFESTARRVESRGFWTQASVRRHKTAPRAFDSSGVVDSAPFDSKRGASVATVTIRQFLYILPIS